MGYFSKSEVVLIVFFFCVRVCKDLKFATSKVGFNKIIDSAVSQEMFWGNSKCIHGRLIIRLFIVHLRRFTSNLTSM